jgi:hypothetical protein
MAHERTITRQHADWLSLKLSGSWSVCTADLEHPRARQQRSIVFDHALVDQLPTPVRRPESNML